MKSAIVISNSENECCSNCKYTADTLIEIGEERLLLCKYCRVSLSESLADVKVTLETNPKPKTYFDDITSRFPALVSATYSQKSMKNNICRKSMYLQDRPYICIDDCIECWDTPMEVGE